MAELEEFQESEVIFSDDDNNGGAIEADFDFPDIFHVSSKHARLISNSAATKKKKIHIANSVPVNIPSDTVFRFEDRYDDDDGEIIPPHVIVGRRISGGKMAYSVSSGNGRTLKGRDLSRVRNSILRLTGFLET